MNRILLADPNPTLCSALALLLETRLNTQIIGQVSSMESLLCETAATQPDVIIIGKDLPGEPARNRLDVLRYIAPDTRILLISPFSEQTCLADGTTAYLCQADLPEIILSVVRKALSSAIPKEIYHV